MTQGTRQKILEATRELCAEHGSRALSMRKVAAQVGVSATALYRHFQDKEHLLMEVCKEGFVRFGMALMRGLHGKTPLERLLLTGQGYVSFALEHPHDYRIMFLSPHPSLEQLARQTSLAISPSFQFLVDRVSECQRAGLIEQEDPDALAMGIWANIHGLVALRLDGHLAAMDPEAFSSFCATHTRRYIDALMP